METLDITVTVPKECYELGEGLAKFIAAVRKASADGWQMGSDIPVLISSAVMDLVPALAGYDKLLPEIKQSPGLAAKALVLCLADVLDSPKA